MCFGPPAPALASCLCMALTRWLAVWYLSRTSVVLSRGSFLGFLEPTLESPEKEPTANWSGAQTLCRPIRRTLFLVTLSLHQVVQDMVLIHSCKGPWYCPSSKV